MDTFADLTFREAGQLIDTLAYVKAAEDVPASLDWLIQTGEEAMAVDTEEQPPADDTEPDEPPEASA